MTARVLSRVLVVVVLVASGAYVFVYLYRWEWNHALLSGLFFVAAEIAVVASVVLRRLSRIEERLDDLRSRPAAEPPPAAGPIAASAPPPRDRFEWLSQSRTSVFLPILLGAGVLLSGAATVVERIAGVTARPVLERRLSLRLQPLALPSGGLLGIAAPAALAALRRGRLVGRAFAAVVAALLLWGAIDLIADATQTRPEPSLQGMTTDFVLSVHHREPGRSVVRTTEALWASCEASFHRTMSGSIDDLGGGRVRLGITPGLGDDNQRRMRGCLDDATLERVRVDVVSSTTRSSAEN